MPPILTTDETVTVDSTPLNQFGFNLQTHTGRLGIPPRRGDNTQVPYRPGAVWKAKQFDQRVETWSMFVVGCDDQGLIPVHGSRAQFNANLMALQRLFGVRQRQLVLEKKILLPTGLLTLTARAECVNTLDPQSMAGGTRAVFSADLLFADPFWYAPIENEAFTSSGTTIAHPGTTEATKMVIRLVGPLTDPRIRNTSRSPVSELRYLGTVPSGRTVTIDTDEFTAVMSVTNENVVRNIRHQGTTFWLELITGNNVMTLDRWSGGSVGGGSVEIDYLPPHL